METVLPQKLCHNLFGSVGAESVFIWTPPLYPRGETYFAVSAPGSSGGAGFSGASGTNRGGGGGGTPGAAVYMAQLTALLPPLRITLGAANVSGVAATASRIEFFAQGKWVTWKVLGTTNNLAQNGTATAGGNGGSLIIATSTPWTAGLPLHQDWAPNRSLGGGAGGAATGAAGTSYGSNTRDAQSAGGGAGVGSNDVGFAGGSFTLFNSLVPTIPGGLAGGGNGSDGSAIYIPGSQMPICTGGSGGGSNGTGQGGRGGNGGPGCGGGGGGAGVTGGLGGNGGVAYCHIVTVAS